MIQGEIPQLRFARPHAGWLPVTLDWQGQSRPLWASASIHDSLFDFVAWLEAILMGALPVVWALNEEEILHYVQAAERGDGDITLTIYAQASYDEDFAEVESAPGRVEMRGEVNAHTLVSQWATSFRHYLATDFDAAAWNSDLRRLDFSRLDALLTGERREEWQADYERLADRALTLKRQVAEQDN